MKRIIRFDPKYSDKDATFSVLGEAERMLFSEEEDSHYYVYSNGGIIWKTNMSESQPLYAPPFRGYDGRDATFMTSFELVLETVLSLPEDADEVSIGEWEQALILESHLLD